ncbi:MAG TPA: response regulator [Planctomycetota bacterium]|nr:response regulator [Planctomycetota bacterium]
MTDSTPRVLAIEDNADDALFLTRAFAKAGVECFDRVLGGGQEAMDYLAGQGPYSDRRRFPLPTHLILDLKLPKVSGLEILAWLRKIPHLSKLRVAILSSSGEKGDREHAESLGIDGYFVKPARSAELVDLVKTLAGLWQLPMRSA